MTLALTGATGQLGRLVIEKLTALNPAQPVVALARSPEKARELGVEVRPFDYDQPDTLAPALDGVETLLLISGSEVGRRVPQHEAVIAAAKTAGVGHIVYTSLLHADTSTLGLAPEHLATEEVLRASGLAHTLLRNGWYTENYTMGLPAALEHKALIGSAGTGRISSATREDFAEAAARVVTDKTLQGRTYELAGDDSYTLSDLAALLSHQAGVEVPYVDMPPAEYAAALVQAGLPEGLAGFLAQCDVEAAKDVLFDDGKQLSQLLGRSTTPLDIAVARAIG
ncbi:NmrA family transcriptional regulator [Thioclava dalianensis]|uniref:NmrA family transcriptional regulator n=1 Tax=Thioclava dalianensis TaxID=1185766 RepID=A0A074UA79_9RHOB|nr:SDR family oxidoreductase [Thioclava dalianensis]KEP71607.1 NmrA family transcriptional regulator [Thioclava dalianensis]SFN43316.1 NAD(P)H dehydrogenase (quinone) [Thioclava dalianensis]